MDGSGVYGKTVKGRLYESDQKERYFHIYHSISKEASERIRFEDKLKTMKTYMMAHRDEKFTFGPMYKKYFYLHYDKENKIFLLPEENTQATERKLDQWRTEEKYDEATDKLKSLLSKKKALQTEELMNAVMKSSRSYEAILRYIQSDSSEEQEL